MTDYRYARTNRPDVDVERQHWALQQAGVAEDAIYTDLVVSGLNQEGQTQLRVLVESVREGDTIIVDHLYRLGRSAPAVAALLADLQQRGVTVQAIDHSADGPLVLAGCAAGGCRATSVEGRG